MANGRTIFSNLSIVKQDPTSCSLSGPIIGRVCSWSKEELSPALSWTNVHQVSKFKWCYKDAKTQLNLCPALCKIRAITSRGLRSAPRLNVISIRNLFSSSNGTCKQSKTGKQIELLDNSNLKQVIYIAYTIRKNCQTQVYATISNLQYRQEYAISTS
jgi:hypothetical protein